LPGVHGSLVLGRVSDETLRFSEGDIGRGGSVSLVVGDDFNTVVLPDTNTGVGGSEIDTDGSLENIVVSFNELGDFVVSVNLFLSSLAVAEGYFPFEQRPLHRSSDSPAGG